MAVTASQHSGYLPVDVWIGELFHYFTGASSFVIVGHLGLPACRGYPSEGRNPRCLCFKRRRWPMFVSWPQGRVGTAGARQIGGILGGG